MTVETPLYYSNVIEGNHQFFFLLILHHIITEINIPGMLSSGSDIIPSNKLHNDCPITFSLYHVNTCPTFSFIVF